MSEPSRCDRKVYGPLPKQSQLRHWLAAWRLSSLDAWPVRWLQASSLVSDVGRGGDRHGWRLTVVVDVEAGSTRRRGEAPMALGIHRWRLLNFKNEYKEQDKTMIRHHSSAGIHQMNEMLENSQELTWDADNKIDSLFEYPYDGIKNEEDFSNNNNPLSSLL
ncbi:hypothetical protein CQW23_26596 [Capsicum baccatum]|uniref:Uncharacterized protein n=1 Tax=Capsicum baccatum TaxID=33114 RepID=A0A2G2VPA4_CAPBA|nr:hypothetical protein CQW23_26596 [Capsicum baccatum]